MSEEPLRNSLEERCGEHGSRSREKTRDKNLSGRVVRKQWSFLVELVSIRVVGLIERGDVRGIEESVREWH